MMLNSTIINELICLMEEKVTSFMFQTKTVETKQPYLLKKSALLKESWSLSLGCNIHLTESWAKGDDCISSRQQGWKVLHVPSTYQF